METALERRLTVLALEANGVRISVVQRLFVNSVASPSGQIITGGIEPVQVLIEHADGREQVVVAIG